MVQGEAEQRVGSPVLHIVSLRCLSDSQVEMLRFLEKSEA